MFVYDLITLLNSMRKGVYPQSDGDLAIVGIDASKGFVDLWVHLTFAIFAIFDLKRQLKLLEMAYDQVLTCLIFPLRWASFPIKIGRNAQWKHLFSMVFDDFSTIYLIFSLKRTFLYENVNLKCFILKWQRYINI